MKQGLNKTMELVPEKKICVEGKHEGHLFEIVLSEVMEKGYLQETDMQRIQIELIEIWKKLIEGFNNGRSSSIQETNAKRLLESIYCTLGYRFSVLEDLDKSITLLQEKSMKVLFEEGQSLIKQRFELLKEEYETLKAVLLPTENIAYRDTYDEGLAPFFTSYSPKYESQECAANIDYPLSNDRMEKVGISYMVDYIEKSLMEHSLLNKFDSKEIEVILEGYHKGYRDLLINIFELVLMNAIGRLIIEKDLSHITLETLEIEQIEKVIEILPNPLLKKLLMDKGMEVLNQLGLTSAKIKAYTAQTIQKYVTRIEVALADEVLDTIFIACKSEGKNEIKYTGGAKLEDKAFKVITEEIRACEKVEDKVQYIRENIHHVEDLKDILEADCIFDMEYEKVYESLEDMEIALLLSSIRIDMNDVVEIEIDRDWFEHLRKYLKQLPVTRQEKIKQLSEEITLC